MSHPAVECIDVSKSFGPNDVLRNITFSVAPGDILALLGPSGCGKTTLLRLIAGFEQVESGTIRIDDVEVATEQLHMPPERRRVGMVFQDYAIFPHLSVFENVRFGLKRGQDGDRRVAEMLELVGLHGAGNAMPHELSGGQQQRVALARALAPQPAVLLLDEPFSNLDANLRRQVRQEVRELLKAGGATAIFVTHDQEEAIYVGDRIAVMNAGLVEQIGTPEEIVHQPRSRFVAEFMGQADVLVATMTESGIATSLGSLPARDGLRHGVQLEVILRPDDVLIDVSGEPNAVVRSRQFVGLDYLYRLELDSGEVIHSRESHTRVFEPGNRVRVTLETDHPLIVLADGNAQQ